MTSSTKRFEPGHFSVLPKGYGFEAFDPKYPHEAFDPFTKSTKRDLAMGLGVSYARADR
ncbi:phage portal protein [Thiohalophilus sp.]|uniref:phage portal protein n=1 Tax=Thiohalophilus sp. TaxID=3028392 RepID=UPI003A0FE225